MTHEQVLELKYSLTKAALDAASQEHIYDFACSFLYDNWDEYSLSELIQEAKRLNVPLPNPPE